jgi:hypothetical protein
MRVRTVTITALLAVVAAVSLGWVAGLGGQSAGKSDAASVATKTVRIQGASRFPDTGLRDWASLADHIVIFTVAADREVNAATTEELAAGEYAIGREAMLSIDRRLWSAPGAPALPAKITMDVKGWAVANGQRYVMVADGEPRLEVGQRYLAPLLLMDDRQPAEWWPLTVSSMLQLDADRVKPANPYAEADSARQLAGRSVREVQDAVGREAAEPTAKRFSNLRPAQRVSKLLEARAAENPVP